VHLPTRPRRSRRRRKNDAAARDAAHLDRHGELQRTDAVVHRGADLRVVEQDWRGKSEGEQEAALARIPWRGSIDEFCVGAGPADADVLCIG